MFRRNAELLGVPTRMKNYAERPHFTDMEMFQNHPSIHPMIGIDCSRRQSPARVRKLLHNRSRDAPSAAVRSRWPDRLNLASTLPPEITQSGFNKLIN